MAKATNFSGINVGDRRRLPGSDIYRIITGQFTLNPASIPADGQAEQTVTISGLTVNDLVFLQPPAAFEALAVGQARVTANDTVKFILVNNTAGAIDAASAVWRYIAFRIA